MNSTRGMTPPRQRPGRLFTLPTYGNRTHGGSQIAITPSTHRQTRHHSCASLRIRQFSRSSSVMNLPVPFPALQFQQSAHLSLLEARGKGTETKNKTIWWRGMEEIVSLPQAPEERSAALPLPTMPSK